jgi:hypothetical protein
MLLGLIYILNSKNGHLTLKCYFVKHVPYQDIMKSNPLYCEKEPDYIETVLSIPGIP